MSEQKEYTLAEIAEHIDSKIVGDSKIIVNNLSTLQKASSNSIAFLANKKYSKLIPNCKASAIIVDESYEIQDKKKLPSIIRSVLGLCKAKFVI